MNLRRSRNDSTQRLAEFRWWGWALLAMFAVVQTARGAVNTEPLVRSSDTTRIASAALSHANAGDALIQIP